MSNPTKDAVRLSANGPEGTKRRSPKRRKSSVQGLAREVQESKKKLQEAKKAEPKIEVRENVHEEPEFEPIRPEEHNVIFKPNPGPQTEFLAAGEREVLYGGAAGGGKSYAMLADPPSFMGPPSFRGLLFRHTTAELRQLVCSSKPIQLKA